MSNGESATPVQAGFGNVFETEAVPGALPRGRNSPQRPPLGLYAEQFSATAFTAPRGDNRRSWLYRLRPSAMHRPYLRSERSTLIRSGPFDEVEPSPNRLRWNPLPVPVEPTDFVDGLVTIAGNGSRDAGDGISIHLFAANRSMVDRVFWSADGELLIVPQGGGMTIWTELGRLDARPGQVALIPRGLRFRVELADPWIRGYVCENHGQMFRLPELGPIGSNGLASARDFQAPLAWFEDVERPTEVVQKFLGGLWTTTLPCSPLDVVAWHGSLTPYTYDLARFQVIGTVSFDHPDPSIVTVLTSPSDTPGVANCDFVIFPPRWLVAEDTFRPPWFHRNVMSEYMGLVHGVYDAKADGFAPGGGSLHNLMSAHGPDRATTVAAMSADLAPTKLEDTLAFMFESRRLIRPTRFAIDGGLLQDDYDACWDGFEKAFVS